MLVHHDRNGRWDESSFEGSLREGVVMLANLREEDCAWGCCIALMLGGGRRLSHGGWLWSRVKSHSFRGLLDGCFLVHNCLPLQALLFFFRPALFPDPVICLLLPPDSGCLFLCPVLHLFPLLALSCLLFLCLLLHLLARLALAHLRVVNLWLVVRTRLQFVCHCMCPIELTSQGGWGVGFQGGRHAGKRSRGDG